MKEHFKKYRILYQIVFIVICLFLTCLFIYLGKNIKKKNHYSEDEAIGIMKLKADQLTRLIEINSSENACKQSVPTTLTKKEMKKYGFDQKHYEQITYTLKCENQTQLVQITIIGKGNLKGYQLKDYISNQKKSD